MIQRDVMFLVKTNPSLNKTMRSAFHVPGPGRQGSWFGCPFISSAIGVQTKRLRHHHYVPLQMHAVCHYEQVTTTECLDGVIQTHMYIIYSSFYDFFVFMFVNNNYQTNRTAAQAKCRIRQVGLGAQANCRIQVRRMVATWS